MHKSLDNARRCETVDGELWLIIFVLFMIAIFLQFHRDAIDLV